MKITFLGGGNMATALIGGMLERGFAAADLQVVELGEAARGALAQRFGVRAVEAFDDAALARRSSGRDSLRSASTTRIPSVRPKRAALRWIASQRTCSRSTAVT